MASSRTSRPADIPIAEYDYNLPAERIADYPLQERDQSKLLVYKNGAIQDSVSYNIADFLQPDSLMVFNHTKVVQARMHFRTSAGATIEIFCLEPADQKGDINSWMQKKSTVRWRCMVGGYKKWKEKQIKLTVEEGSGTVILSAELIEKEPAAFIVEFSWEPEDYTFADILEKAGKVPLPPYIEREAQEEDKSRYQTVYARHKGSVAAPTAGLHFTPRVFEALEKKNIEKEYLTLHVGAGTFRPVKSATIGLHEMHSEQILVEKSFLEKLRDSLSKDIVAVGTTSLRTLESLYWLGLRISRGQNDLMVGQWDPYEMEAKLSAKEALGALIRHLEDQKETILLARTQLMIAPGYQFKLVNVLATNFHQPKSTLILLVAAFIGEDWKKVYEHALENNYRFLSYGDGSLLFRR